MKTALKLYNNHNAPSPRRARIFLAEKGIEVEKVQVDIANKEHVSEAFRKINPRCTVPVLVTEEGAYLTENLSIASYLEEKFPKPPLLGQTAVERALVLERNWCCESEGFVAVAEKFRNSHPAFKGRALTGPDDFAQIPELVERGDRRIAAFFRHLNMLLESHDFVAGENFSMADISALIVTEFAGWKPIGASPDKSLEALHAWYARMRERPSYDA